MTLTGDAYNRRQKTYRLERQRGISRRVDARSTVEHVRVLRAAGAHLKAIAELAGIDHDSVQRLDERARVFRSTRDRILVVTVEQALAASPDTARVPAIGTRRRLQALMANGWPRGALTVRCGRQVSSLLAAERPSVLLGIRRDVATTYRELSSVRGPSDRVATVAAAKGWPPPDAWDDEPGMHFIDDPAAVPIPADTGVPADDAIHLLRGSVGIEEAAARCGIAVDSIMTTLRRRAHRAGPGSADAALYAQILAERARATASARRRAS